MWIAILAGRVSPAPLLLQVVPFFWGLRFAAMPLLLDPRGELPARLPDSQAGLPGAVAEIGLRLQAVGSGPILVLLGSTLTLVALGLSVASGARSERAKRVARSRRAPDPARRS
ncbi:MAG: hypothetical protein L0323_22050 [Planctomycetes bacterium]|nr:hypothetical protein [Planctomycetota bacterium]